MVHLLVLALVATLLGRLWFVQVASAETYQRAAAENRTREVALPAVRGVVLDAAGRPLVANRTSMVVAVSRSGLLAQDDQGAAVLARLADLLGRPFGQVWGATRLCGTLQAPEPPACWNGSPFAPIPVAEDVAPDIALSVLERREDFPGVSAEMRPVREYPLPEGARAVHALGYSGPAPTGVETAGRAGLELAYDADLRGRPGSRTLAVDHRGAVRAKVAERAPVPGSSLVTSLDASVQAVVERELQGAVERARRGENADGRAYAADSGAVVVLDHRSGRVVAMASYPSYDPNVWVGGISTEDYAEITSQAAGFPDFSRATQGEYAPASTFKVVTASAAAAAGYSLDATYPCTADYAVGSRSFRNYESQPYGDVPLSRALEVSCNTVFYRLGHEMWLRDGGNAPVDEPAEWVARTAAGFGLGRPTGIDLPAEAAGRVVDGAFLWQRHADNREQWCRWAAEGYPAADAQRARAVTEVMAENCADGDRVRAGDAVNASIGQGETTVTPLQLAVAYGAIGNGGTVWSPRVGAEVRSPDGALLRRIDPVVAGAVPASTETLAYLRQSLYGVSTDGTAAGVFPGFPLAELPIGSKTGSAQVAGKDATSWFASFSDRYAVVMVVSQGGTGAGTSGPAVRGIYEALYGVLDGAVTRPEGLP